MFEVKEDTMLFKSIFSQCKIIYKQKLFLITVLIMYVFIIINYARNVKEFYGSIIIVTQMIGRLHTAMMWLKST